MRIFQRIVLLIKVLVMLSLGTSAAWACTQPPQDQEAGFSASNSVLGSSLVVAAKSESGDEAGDSEGDDGSTTDEPDTGDGGTDEGDSQS